MSSGQDKSLSRTSSPSSGERDMLAAEEVAANTATGINKRAGSPSLKNSVPPKRLQLEYAEQPTPVHLGTPQREKTQRERPSQATTLRIPARNESNQRQNTYNGGGPETGDHGLPFQPTNTPQYRDPDPRYLRSENHVAECYGAQPRSNHESFSYMELVTPRIPSPVLHRRQDWDDFDDPNVSVTQGARRVYEGRSEVPSRHQQHFQRQLVGQPSTVYHSGGGRIHNVVDLTSPTVEQRFYKTATSERASPISTQYQARRPGPNQHYPRSRNGFYEENRHNESHVTYQKEPPFGVDREFNHRRDIPRDRLELGSSLFSKGIHQRRPPFADPMAAPAPARLRQKRSYNSLDMTRVDHKSQGMDPLTRGSVAPHTQFMTRDVPYSRTMNKGYDLQHGLSDRQEEPLREDDSEDETLTQMMRRSNAAGRTEKSQPITRAPLPAEGLDLPTNRQMDSTLEAGSNVRSAIKSRAQEVNNLKMQRTAAEKIIELEQQGKELEKFDDIFEESPAAKASAARIQKSIKEDANRKHRREEDQIAKKFKSDYLQMVEGVRKKREDLARQARREERKSRVTDEERRAAQEKEAERIEKKRIAAEEVLERVRLQRQEAALNETLKKLDAERVVAKKQATSLRSARKRNISARIHMDDSGGQGGSSDCGMFINSDDDEFPAVNHIEKSSRYEFKDGLAKKGKRADEGRTIAGLSEVTAATLNNTPIAAIANDERRRAPPARQPQKLPSRIRNRAKEARDTAVVDRKIEVLLKKTLQEMEKMKADAKATEKARKQQWDKMVPQLIGALKVREEPPEPSKRQDTVSGLAPGVHVINAAARPRLFNSVRGKTMTLTSQIKFVTQVESEAKEKEESERADMEKHEKAKRVYFQRTHQEIRRALTSQGIEIDEEKIKKSVEDRMAVWEEKKRRKKAQKENKENGSPGNPSNTSDSALPQNENRDVSSTTSGTNRDGGETQASDEDMETKKREEGVRAGLSYLRAKNTAANGFVDAASKSIVQELESEESEEDPDDDDEPETFPGPTTNSPKPDAEKPSWLSAQAPSTDPSDEIKDTGDDITAISSISDAVGPPAVSDALTLPVVINPSESDLVYVYNVNQRSERGDKAFDTLVLASFHDLDEANAFAQQKTNELIYNPDLSLIAKEETYDRDARYIGKAINDKDKNEFELVWVSQVISYIGDVSNLTPDDIKPIKPCKVFNIIQTIRENDTSPESSVITTTTMKTLANQKAADSFLALCKPRKPDIDLVQRHNNVTIPTVRANLSELDRRDECVCFEGEDEQAGLWFKVEVCEADVVGPRN